jgi:hypothetical protein
MSEQRHFIEPQTLLSHVLTFPDAPNTPPFVFSETIELDLEDIVELPRTPPPIHET